MMFGVLWRWRRVGRQVGGELVDRWRVVWWSSGDGGFGRERRWSGIGQTGV